MDAASKLASDPHTAYVFNGFTLDVDRAALIYAGENVRLRPQSFDVLRYLVEHRGRLVTKAELLNDIWGNTAVTDDSLTHCLIDIRKAIGDTTKDMIKTVSRRGFIFDLPVASAPASPSGSVAHEYPDSLWKLVVSVIIVLGLAFAVMGGANRTTNASIANASVSVGKNEKAQERYSQAWFLFQRRQPGDLDTARDYFQQAIAIDPDFAKAWAGLAGVYRVQIADKQKLDDSIVERFKEAAQRAVDLDPELAEANIRLSQYYWTVDDKEASTRYFKRAVELQPDDPLMLSIFAGMHAAAGRLDEAIEIQTRAVAMGPLSKVNHNNLAHFLFAAGRYNEVVEQVQRAGEIYPELPADLAFLDIFSYILLQQYERALARMEKLPAGPDKNEAMGMVHYALGREREASRFSERLVSSPGADTYIRLAELHAFRQDIDASFIWLTELREHLDHDLNPVVVWGHLNRVQMSPFLAAVRDDPRWESWLTVTEQILM